MQVREDASHLLLECRVLESIVRAGCRKLAAMGISVRMASGFVGLVLGEVPTYEGALTCVKMVGDVHSRVTRCSCRRDRGQGVLEQERSRSTSTTGTRDDEDSPPEHSQIDK